MGVGVGVGGHQVFALHHNVYKMHASTCSLMQQKPVFTQLYTEMCDMKDTATKEKEKKKGTCMI